MSASTPGKTDRSRLAALWDGLIGSGPLWTALRLGALALFAAVAAAAWGRYSIPEVPASDPLMYTNLGNLAFWVIWMMGIVLLAPLLGRLWCGVCPLGWLNELAGRWGLSQSVPRWLQNEYPKALLLLATVILIGLARIHHYPGATAIYLAAWAALAIAMGAVFSGRALCRSLCPVGGMLGMYGRCAPFEVRVRDARVCDGCEGKECVRGQARQATLALSRLRVALSWVRRPCPVSLRVWDMRGTGRCLFCLNCLRACPYGNVTVGGRAPLAALWRERYPRFSEAAMAAALLGFVLLGFLKFWPGLETVLASPVRLASGLAGEGASRVLYLLWLGFALPWIVIVAPSAALRARAALSRPSEGPTGGPAEPGAAIRIWFAPADAGARVDHDDGESVEEGVSTARGLTAAFLPALVPVLLSGHLVLAMVKVNAKAAYLPLALFDPAGVRSYMAVEELGILPRPGLLAGIGATRLAAAALIATGLLASLWAASCIGRRERTPVWPYALQILAVAAVTAGGLVKWLF